MKIKSKFLILSIFFSLTSASKVKSEAAYKNISYLTGGITTLTILKTLSEIKNVSDLQEQIKSRKIKSGRSYPPKAYSETFEIAESKKQIFRYAPIAILGLIATYRLSQ